MAQDKWLSTSGGDFATASNWSTGAVPGAADDALLTTVGTYTVTSNQSETVNSIQIVQHVTLAVNNGVFYAEKGTGTGVNNGLISVANNATLEVGGTLAGTGTIALNSGGNGTDFILNSATTTLTGGGKLILGDNFNNRVYGNAPADLLVNVNDTISGSGQFGTGQMSFSNGAAGIINATGTNSELLINLGAGTGSNAGLIEDTNTGGLSIQSSTITQSGTGTIKAVGAGSFVNLDNGVIVGGTLATTTGGVIQSVNNGELNGLTITAGSTVTALNNTDIRLDNTITNNGTITLNSGGNATDLIINTPTVTLTGGGKVVMDDNGNNRIYGAPSSSPFDKLINVNNTISGSGQIGVGQLILVNQVGGTIDATGTNAGLTFSTNSFTNAGLIEDTNTGGVGIASSVVTNTGTFAAFGAGSTVNVYGGSTIIGGTFATSGGGVIETTQTGTLDGSGTLPITITTGSQIGVANNSQLSLLGSIVNHGTFNLNSIGNGTDLIMVTPTVTLSGGGTVLMSDNGNNRIYGSVGSAPFNTLINVDNTIAGSGQIGVGQLNVVNQASGIIDATGTSAGLTISTGTGGSFSNLGLIEDTGPAGLGIQSTVITNTGIILASGSLTSVNLYNGSTIAGGTLTANKGGVFETTNTGTLDGSTHAVTLTTGTNFDVFNNTSLYVLGSIINHGTIALLSGGNGTPLIINSATVTLSGGGTVLLSDNSNNQIYGAATADVLVNVDNTIVGSGQIGAQQGSFINEAAGVINSNGTSGLTISTGGGSFTNAGLIEDTGPAGLGIAATTITNTATIAAFGAGTTVNVYNGGIIAGGLLTSSGGGIFETTNSATLDGSGAAVTLSTGTSFDIINNDVLYLLGSIVNHGTIALLSGGNGTDLIMNTATVTLSGGGTVLMSDNSNNQIYGAVATNVLVNVDNTIVGSGRIGAGQGSVINKVGGVINANGNAGLTINTSGGSFNNAGLIEDTGAGGIGIVSVLTNTGTIAAIGAGATVNILNGAVIAGGVLTSSAGGEFLTTNFGTLDGSAAALTLGTGSYFNILNNTNLYLMGTIANKGTIAINSGGNGTGLIVNSPTVTLSGHGVVQMSDNGNNYFYGAATADKLINFNNTIAGAGNLGDGQLTLDNQAAGVIDAIGNNGLSISLGSTFTNEGLVEAAGPNGLVIQNATLTNTGTIASLTDSGVNITSTTTITNFSAGTLTGGTWEAISAGSGHSSTLTIAAGPITTDNAHLVISGVGAGIVAGGTSVVTSITTIGSTGELDIQNGATFTALNPLAVSGTILLAGSLSSSAITITTKGLISANGGTSTLSTTGRLLNNGTLQATTGGTLSIAGGSLNNAGTVVAQAGGTVVTTAAERVTNFATGTLTGGTWEAIGSGVLTIGIGVITTDAATLTLSGPASLIRSGASARQLDGSLTTVAATGVLNVLNARSFASGSVTGLADNGIITLGGGTFSASGLTIASGATFDGGGTVASAVTDNGLLLSSAAPLGSTGTLTVTGAITGTGLLSAGVATSLIASGGYAVGTLSAAGTVIGAGSVSGAVTVAGTLTIGATGTLNAGSVTVQKGGLLSGASIISTGAVSDGGVISLSGGTLSGTSISVAAGVLMGYGTVAKHIANSGTIQATGGTLTLNVGESGGTAAAVAGATLASEMLLASKLVIAAGGSFIGAGSANTTTDSGTVTASGGTLTLTAVSGTGTAAISGAATLNSTGALVVSGVSYTSGSSETLALGTPAGNTALISNFGSGDTIDLLNATVTSFVYAPAQGILTLKDGTTTLGTLKFAGSYTKASFLLQSDGANGTDVVFAGTGSAAPPANPMADLQAAVSATTGNAYSVGLVTPAPAVALATTPALAGSFGVTLPTEHMFDAPAGHFTA